MPRSIRKQSKSSIYHVMIRGNERKNLFLDDEDKARFIDTLFSLSGHANNGEKHSTIISSPETQHKKKRFYVYAYCLMDNHVHLLINQGEDDISRIIKRLGVSYVHYFNRKYGRVGHLFQDRFRSEAVEDESYLLAAVRYIHNNPVKACLVEKASQYPWSSYNEYVGNRKLSSPMDIGTILGIFSEDKRRAKELFKDYSTQEDDLQFIEYAQEESKEISGTKEANVYIRDWLKSEGILLEDIGTKINRQKRDELMQQLKERSSLSVRQIADILGVDRGMVQRVKV